MMSTMATEKYSQIITADSSSYLGTTRHCRQF